MCRCGARAGRPGEGRRRGAVGTGDGSGAHLGIGAGIGQDTLVAYPTNVVWRRAGTRNAGAVYGGGFLRARGEYGGAGGADGRDDRKAGRGRRRRER